MKRIILSAVITIIAAFGYADTYAQGSADNVVPAQIVTTPNLALPREAYESGLGGTVRVKISIDESGNVTSVDDVIGPGAVCRQAKRDDVTAMRDAAREASMRARFNPATRKGKPIASSLWLNFDFPGSETTGGVVASNTPTPGADSTKYTVKADSGFGVAGVNSSGEVRAAGEIPKMIKGGVVNGKAISLPKPAYPPAARAVRASGAVSIQVLIDENGDVFSASAVSGHPLLRAAAATAACDARFSRTVLAGYPVRVTGIITYNFVP
jgi:TonB family protein